MAMATALRRPVYGLVIGPLLIALCCGQKALGAVTPTTTTQLGCAQAMSDAWPMSAHLVPVRDAAALQTSLNKYGSVRLQAFGNYTKNGGPKVLRLSSGQHVYGLLGTKVGRVVVSPGATGVILQGVATQGIEFPPSPLATERNCFIRLSGGVYARGATLQNNLFAGLRDSPIRIDTKANGYLRKNLFVGVMVHGQSPGVQVIGDPRQQSYDNIFLWLNLLTPRGEGIEIKNQKNVSFIGLDAESWNWSRPPHRRAMMNVQSTGSLSVIGASGGDPKHRSGRYFDVDARNFTLVGTRIGPVGNPAIRLGPGVRRSALLGVGRLSYFAAKRGVNHLSAYSLGEEGVRVDGVSVRRASPRPTQISDLVGMLAARPRLRRWGLIPVSGIADPAGSGWTVNRTHRPDSASYIQSLIDSRGVAYLPAGTYYISRPIRLGPNQGIVGAGQSRTAIIAESPSIDLIMAVRANHAPAQSRFMLADLTLQGGRNGIVTDGAEAGIRTQFSGIFLSHVTIRNMSRSGILVRGIYGWDNNFIDNLTLYRCAEAGVRQVVEGGWKWRLGEKAKMTYMDKNIFYRSRFVQNGTGVALRAHRADNLNAFIGCDFRDNERSAAILRNNNLALFAGCHFAASGRDITIRSDRPVYIVDSSFISGSGNKAFLAPGAICDGCSFAQGGRGHATITAGGGRILLLNSISRGVPLGAPNSGVLINSPIPEIPMTGRLITVLEHGVPKPVGGLRVKSE